MIKVHCGSLVTVNDLWSPHTLYGMREPCNCQWLLWFPLPYMECRNLVTFNDSYGPPIPYMECGNLVMGSPYMYNMIWMWEPCNCQWLMVPIPYMEYGNLVYCQWLLWSPHTLNGMWELCNRVPTCMMGEPCNCQWHLWSPILYMECGNLITVNDWWSPHTLYGIWEPCNCQWLLWSPHTLYGMQEPCNCQWLIVPHTLYGIWEPCNCQWLLCPLIPYMECGNLVTVNDLWSPNTYMEWRNCQWLLSSAIPYTICVNLVNEWLIVHPYLTWNVETL